MADQEETVDREETVDAGLEGEGEEFEGDLGDAARTKGTGAGIIGLGSCI